tara:strand:- start:4046 stop:5692 length:1647 start_codon:yes stop_codon:yes gene_type:complete
MEKYYWLNSKSRTFLERGYLQNGVSPEDRIKEIAKAAEKRLCIEGFAEKFEDYMSRGWYSLASPIWANFGLERGLPISCYGSYIGDKMESILNGVAEVGMMSKVGGGTSAYFGDLRGRGAPISSGGESTGSVHFMELYETVANVVSQSNVRRGSFAGYMNIDHPDILEFLAIRNDGHAIQNMSIGVTVSNEWMTSMVDGDTEKRKIWAKVIQKRFESGYPYIFWSDNVNDDAPKIYKKKKKRIHASNLCSEIALSTDEDESFVCCLSSMNLLHYDEWKDTDAVEVLTYFLDAVISEFVDKAFHIPFMRKAVRFAEQQRAVGVGVLGWHSYLQSCNIAFESFEAKNLSAEIFKNMREKCDGATKFLASWLGEPKLLQGTGRRNVTTMAIAPTTSSSFILGQVSPSVEPLNSNYFVKDLAKGKFTYKNPYLREVLKSYDRNTPEVWQSILVSGGSVQHLHFLTDHERNVFKTFGEIPQLEIINQTVIRQKYIDQSQSINLMIHPKTSVKEVNKLLIHAWEHGVKTLYYHRGTNPSQELSRNLLNCSSCEA